MPSRILVTGATGNVGQHVVGALEQSGLRPVIAVRDEGRGRRRFGPQREMVRLDFHDPSSWARAVDGVAGVFLVRPPAIADVQNSINPFLDAARERGVGHVVFLSVAGAGRNRLVPHRSVEDHLRRIGQSFTNLRPGFFAQNLSSAYRRDIAEDDRIYVPAGRRQPVNWIDARDIAKVAAVVFAAPEAHRAQSYTLTGPEPVSWSVVTDALSSTLGRTIRYQPASVLGYLRHLSRRGHPRGAMAVQTVLHVMLRFGQGAGFDPTMEHLLGRPGCSVRAFIEDHAEVWARASAPQGAGAA